MVKLDDPGLHLLQGDQRGFLLLGQLDDVIPELRCHHVADLAGLQREGRLIERRHHLAAREEAEIAALAALPSAELSLASAAKSSPALARFRTRRSWRAAPSSSPRRRLLAFTRMWLARTVSACLNLSGFFA